MVTGLNGFGYAGCRANALGNLFFSLVLRFGIKVCGSPVSMDNSDPKYPDTCGLSMDIEP